MSVSLSQLYFVFLVEYCSHLKLLITIYLVQGTIVEWTAQVGQAVQEEDVIALIETDKVTVDIKAEMSGVITEQFGQV